MRCVFFLFCLRSHRSSKDLWLIHFSPFPPLSSPFRRVDELKAVMKNESPEKIAKYIEEYDIDKDGTISYEEFMRMLLPKDLKFKITSF